MAFYSFSEYFSVTPSRVCQFTSFKMVYAEGEERLKRQVSPRGQIVKMSDASRGRLRKVTDVFEYIVRRDHLGFVLLTLTYPSDVSTIGKRCKYHLNRFCQRLNEDGVYWVWRLEKQENGNPHFHFLLSKYVDWRVYRTLWNSFLGRDGLIAPYTEKFSKMSLKEYIDYRMSTDYRKPKLEAVKEAYKRGVSTGWTDPNALDVKEVRANAAYKAVRQYVSKYVAKGNDDIAGFGRAWGVDRVLGSLTSFSVECTSDLSVSFREEKAQKEIVEDYYVVKYYGIGNLPTGFQCFYDGKVMEMLENWSSGRMTMHLKECVSNSSNGYAVDVGSNDEPDAWLLQPPTPFLWELESEEDKSKQWVQKDLLIFDKQFNFDCWGGQKEEEPFDIECRKLKYADGGVFSFPVVWIELDNGF